MPTHPFERAVDTAIHEWLDTRPKELDALDKIARECSDEVKEAVDAADQSWALIEAVRLMSSHLDASFTRITENPIRLYGVIFATAVRFVPWHEIAQAAIDRVLDAEEAGLGPEIGVDAFGQQEGNK